MTRTSTRKEMRIKKNALLFFLGETRRDEARSGGCGAVACEPAGGGIGVGACRR